MKKTGLVVALVFLTPLLLGIGCIAIAYFSIDFLFNLYDRSLNHLESRKKMNLKFKAHVQKSVFFDNKKGR